MTERRTNERTNVRTNERTYEQTNGQRKSENYIPPHTSYVGGIIKELENAFYTSFSTLEQFVTYFQFKLILEEIRQSTQNAIVYLENLRTELNMLSLNLCHQVQTHYF